MPKFELHLSGRRTGLPIKERPDALIIIVAADKNHAERLWIDMKNRREFHRLKLSKITTTK
jgi:hypothetical protein